MKWNYMLHHEQNTEHSFDIEKWEKEIEDAEQRGYENGVRDEQKREREEKRKRDKEKKEVIRLLL